MPPVGGVMEKFEAAIAEAITRGSKTRVEAIKAAAQANPSLYREYSQATVGATNKITYPESDSE